MKSIHCFSKKAQAAFEYAVLITIVAAAIAAITAYCQRSVNARVEDIRQEYAAP